MCGPSGAEKNIAGQSGNFFNELQGSYNAAFAGQEGILSSINSALEPILQGGPNQQGFSAAENAALTGSAINNSAAQARNAETIAGASAGGNTGVTTGGQKQLQAGIASQAGQALAGQENQINLANYAQGRQNFFGAEGGLAGAAGLYNPNATAGATTSAGNAAFGQATQIQNMKNQEQADIGGAVAGLAGTVLGGPIGGAIGKGISNLFTPPPTEDYYGNQG